MSRRLFLITPLLVLLVGCDQLGIESPAVAAARREADGKAVGAACRQGGRALEDCFNLNRKTDKASIYAGWREMDDYMRENKMQVVTPQLSPPAAKAPGADDTADGDASKSSSADAADKGSAAG
jgi:hypothetical protein